MSAGVRSNWFWSDWLGDIAVRRLTPAERGLWIDLIGLAAFGHPRGYVCDQRGSPIGIEEIARTSNCTTKEAGKLVENIIAKGAASRDEHGRIYNRRMVRDTELGAKRALAGQSGGQTTGSLLKQMPRQMPEQVPRQNPNLLKQLPKPLLDTPGIPFPLSKITSTESGTAREEGVGQCRRPADLSRADLDAVIAAKAAGK